MSDRTLNVVICFMLALFVGVFVHLMRLDYLRRDDARECQARTCDVGTPIYTEGACVCASQPRRVAP